MNAEVPAVELLLPPGTEADAIRARESAWGRDRLPERVWKKDPSLWPEAPAAEVPDRTGWLDLPARMGGEIAGLTAFTEEVRGEGFDHAVLLGMGGSSLAPHVFRGVFGHRVGHLDLTVLDSTHPDAVARVASSVPLDRTLFVVSSKSGTTLEPLSFMRFFWQRVKALGRPPGRQFIAITDPGTPLASLARDRGFRRVFDALPTVGGRYSALTFFGLVPAALLGIDLKALQEGAARMAAACGPSKAPPENPGVHLGAIVGELASRGRNKLTVHAGGHLALFPIWLEQLVAESTGKHGRGIVPVAAEPAIPPSRYGADRLFVEIQDATAQDTGLAQQTDRLIASGQPVVRIRVPSPVSLGGEFLRWELAIALAGSVIGIDPFDQPDVEIAKELAREAMQGASSGGKVSAPAPQPLPVADTAALRRALVAWAEGRESGGYVAIQAFVAPTPEMARALDDLRAVLLQALHLPLTMGYGPRFLHSTGQLHKGGPAGGLFLQLTDEPQADLPVPEEDYTFGQIIRAQAQGDAQALVQRQRRVLRVHLGGDPLQGVAQLKGALPW